MKNEKIITALTQSNLENISGGEVHQYRSIWTLWRRRFRVTNDISGQIALDGIKDFNEALALNEKLNSHIDKNIKKKEK